MGVHLAGQSLLNVWVIHRNKIFSWRAWFSTKLLIMRPPRIDLLPPAIRSAERLHGTFVPCGPGLRPVGWPDAPAIRRIAVADMLPRQLIASNLTAAWIWMSARNPGKPLRAIQQPSTRNGFRAGRSLMDVVYVRHQRITREDVAMFDDLGVTTPYRTVLDLLRDPERFDVPCQVACRLLFTRYQGIARQVVCTIQEARHPQRPISRERLAKLISVPRP